MLTWCTPHDRLSCPVHAAAPSMLRYCPCCDHTASAPRLQLPEAVVLLGGLSEPEDPRARDLP